MKKGKSGRDDKTKKTTQTFRLFCARIAPPKHTLSLPLPPLTMALPLAALLALVALALAVAVAAASAFLKHAASPFLDGASFKPMTLVERVELTHNTRLFR